MNEDWHTFLITTLICAIVNRKYMKNPAFVRYITNGIYTFTADGC